MRRWVSLLTMFCVVMNLLCQAASAEPVAVRFPQGMTHGFLLVRSVAGDVLGQGEVTQIVKAGDLVESHLVFDFKDGSVHDETVVFSQQRLLTLIRYQLIQRGPSFPEQIEVSMDRSTAGYKVRSREGTEREEKTVSGEFALPKDAYNGMLVTVLLNLPKAASETVRIVSFNPRPQVFKLELQFDGEQMARIGQSSRKALKYVFKPDIGTIRGFVGKLLGKLPEDFHYTCWILADEISSFVRFEGPMHLKGPIVHIELVSPALHAQ
jgi:hypothetical protein